MKKSGPFQIIWSESPEDTPKQSPHSSATSNSSTDLSPNPTPVRRYECDNYQSCLEIAAALNWESFTCGECEGEFDDRLVWQAQLAQRNDKIAKKLCALPEITCFEALKVENSDRTEPSGKTPLIRARKLALKK